MPITPFHHHRPATLAAALELLAKHEDDASPIAGGTELLVALKAKVLRYAHLIDLKQIRGLRGVATGPDGDIVIGALSTHFELAHDPLIRERIPAYARLSDNIANIRVRVAGTLGGNLCFAEPHADPPALLAALGAEVLLAGPDGERRVLLADFIESEFTTVRQPNEILTAIRIPSPPANARFAYRSFGHLERPAVGIAAARIETASGAEYRIWAGAICGKPTRLPSVERALKGVPVDQLGDVLAPAADGAVNSLPAHGDIHGSADYKQHLASVFIKRMVMEVSGT
jgi:carbon-monoxide dehydrogenase medium subunit